MMTLKFNRLVEVDRGKMASVTSPYVNY